ncbi:hypothetical protein WJ50_07505 [Burkholderia ubonensis]|nr:hypothetical protein WJ49_22095 [Burkholderia ubonensis]KVL72402.1 hypothetical protein WJ48_06575 [Burkholderia ubonensis]KVL94914.1 hypothetical protein WJ50_07505 [Burkholderia ubonensis]
MNARHKRDFATNDRLPRIALLAAVIGVLSTLAAFVLLNLIHLFTNLFFFQRFSFADHAPAGNALGAWVIAVPVIGGLIVGMMARFGSEKIRGHGIPEAIEAILFGKSRMSPKVAVLKPLSSGVVIGSGGPFGAEGPIIMTGGALGSLIAQCVKVTAAERKTLLVAGAAAGMTAVFGTPVAAVLLAATLVAHGFATVVMKRSIMTEKIARRGYHIYREYGVDPLERHDVAEVMTRADAIVAIDAATTLAEVDATFFGARQTHRAYPVVQDGRLLGVVDRALLDAQRASRAPGTPIADVLAGRAPVVALAHETCRLVATRLAVHGLGSVYIRNAHALPRERPLARRATPRILDVSPRSATRRAAVLVATPNLNFIPRECPKSPVWRRRASLVWLGQTALLAPCPTSDFGHSHVRSVCKQTLERLPVVDDAQSLRMTGLVSRSDLIKPALQHFDDEHQRERFRPIVPANARKAG